MMPKSPIPDKLWTTMFAASVGGLATALVFSFWNQHREARSHFVDEWKIIGAKRGQKPASEVAEALRTIYSKIIEEKRFKKGTAILSVHDNAHALLQHLHLEENDEDSSLVATLAVQLVVLCFTKDRETRTLMAFNGGYIRLVALMSMAHSFGEVRVLDICAEALRDATSIGENELVLPTDVPEGCEGTYKLSQQKLIPKILRTLMDSKARPRLLEAMSATVANICTLRAGAQALSAGIDNTRALEIFIRLISECQNSLVRANCLRGICALLAHVRDDMHYLVTSKDTLAVVIDLVTPDIDPSVLEQALRALSLAWDSVAFRESYVMSVRETDLVKRLCEVWISQADRLLRARSELLVKHFGSHAVTAGAVEQALDYYGQDIAVRKQKDHAEDKERREQEQRRAQDSEMMMRQMMQQGGIPPQMMAAMMGED